MGDYCGLHFGHRPSCGHTSDAKGVPRRVRSNLGAWVNTRTDAPDRSQLAFRGAANAAGGASSSLKPVRRPIGTRGSLPRSAH